MFIIVISLAFIMHKYDLTSNYFVFIIAHDEPMQISQLNVN